MKNLLMMLMSLAIMTTASAQEPDKKGESHKEKMEAAKIGFITKELQLTPEEAQKFWPVYNQREAELEEVRKAMRKIHKDRKIEEMSDAEADKAMEDMMLLRQRELDIDKKYHAEFKKVLPIKKVAQLYHAEMKFRHEVMKEWKERHGHGPHGQEGHGQKGNPEKKQGK
jgi:Spy/CpxP family protein refolding chaperone